MAVAGGQYGESKGLFFGGNTLQEGPRLLKAHLEALGVPGVEALVVWDIHTGLGPPGYDTVILNKSGTAAEAKIEAHAVLGVTTEAGGLLFMSNDGRGNVGYAPAGLVGKGILSLCAGDKGRWAEVTSEFGTVNSVVALKALIDENWYHHHGDGRLDADSWQKQRLRSAFNPSPVVGRGWWKERVLARGEVMVPALLDCLESF